VIPTKGATGTSRIAIHRKVQLVGVNVLVGVAFVSLAGCSSSSPTAASPTTTTLPATTVPTTSTTTTPPSLTATTAPSAAALVQKWWKNTGNYDLTGIGGDLASFAVDSALDHDTTASDDCLALSVDVGEGQHDPPIPDPALQAEWAKVLTDYGTFSTECQNGINKKNTADLQAALAAEQATSLP